MCRRQRDKIDVLTFGGARSITRKYFSGRVGRCYADALNAHVVGGKTSAKDAAQYLLKLVAPLLLCPKAQSCDV